MQNRIETEQIKLDLRPIKRYQICGKVITQGEVESACKWKIINEFKQNVPVEWWPAILEFLKQKEGKNEN